MAAATVQAVAKAYRSLLPSKLPPSLAQNAGNLYEVLSRSPGAADKRVYQTRWRAKNIIGSYWLVTRARFKCEGKHGKAWGKLYWKGKLVSPREEQIRGGLKYNWQEGVS